MWIDDIFMFTFTFSVKLLAWLISLLRQFPCVLWKQSNPFQQCTAGHLCNKILWQVFQGFWIGWLSYCSHSKVRVRDSVHCFCFILYKVIYYDSSFRLLCSVIFYFINSYRDLFLHYFTEGFKPLQSWQLSLIFLS